MRHDPIRLSAAALALTLTLPGCGGDDEPAAGSAPPSITAASTPSAARPALDAAQLAAVQSAIDEDKRIGEWFLEQASAPGVDRHGLILVAHDRMADIDLAACPRDFADAYSSHIAAWADAVAAIDSAADPAVSADLFTRSLFGDLAAADRLTGQLPALKTALDAVRRTAMRYLDRAERHGAKVEIQVIMR